MNLYSLLSNIQMVYSMLKIHCSLSQLRTISQYLFIVIFLYISVYLYVKSRTSEITLSTTNVDITKTAISRYKLFINEKGENLAAFYYRHGTATRNSSYPFISGDTFRSMADYVFDELRKDKLGSVQYGNIVFVKADMLRDFFTQAYETIKKPFILVTHNSDYSVPLEYGSRLKDEKIIAWYTSNPSIKNHPKLFPIPLGLANIRWPFGNLSRFMYAFEKYRKPWKSRQILLYVNFSPGSNEKQRFAALAQVKNFKNIHIVRDKLSLDMYLQQVGNAKFVLSPPGNGLDCHRTWEAVLMGAAPVTISSTINPLFNQIPAVMVNDWINLTERLLLSKQFSSYDGMTANVLYARYWRERLQKHQVH